MNYSQGDLVFLKQPNTLPDGQVLKHPILIVSHNTANIAEDFYTGVMMTSSNHKDKFSFQVDNTMFESPIEKEGCQLRLYIIFSFREADIHRLVSRIKKPHLKNLLIQIKETVFVI